MSSIQAPPAFQFYASDYLSSKKVQLMTLEAEGAYIRLLAYQWQDGWIPADVGKLARLCKTTPRKMAVLWDEYLRECFEPLVNDPDKLVNPKLEAIRQQQLEYRQRKADAGRNGGLSSGEARAKQKGSSASIVLEPNGKQNEALQSSISNLQSSSSKHIEEFARLWATYPNPRGKIAAERHFMAKVKTDEDLRDIQSALENYIATRNYENLQRKEHGESVIPWQNGSTWFNNWRDWIPKPEPEPYHPRHSCPFCEMQHFWECSDSADCTLDVIAACPEFISLRRKAVNA